MRRPAILASVLVLGLVPIAASAQTTDQRQPRQQERVGEIFNSLFGDRFGSGSIESQWALGRMPLATQRAQFETNVTTELRSGGITEATATRLRTDYSDLVQLEARYGADRRFTTQERSELSDRYGRLTQALADRSYGDEVKGGDVFNGRADFERRVDAGLSSRRLSRVDGGRLKSDYAALIDVEAGYLRDGQLSSREREDLDSRLDALDARVGDTGYGSNSAAAATPRGRLEAIGRALPSSGLSAAALAQLKVEHGDLLRLDEAYGRSTASADDRAYLDRRVADLETRARVRR